MKSIKGAHCGACSSNLSVSRGGGLYQEPCTALLRSMAGFASTFSEFPRSRSLILRLRSLTPHRRRCYRQRGLLGWIRSKTQQLLATNARLPVPKSGSVEEQIYVASMLFFLAYTDTERGVIPLSLIFFLSGIFGCSAQCHESHSGKMRRMAAWRSHVAGAKGRVRWGWECLRVL